MIQNRTVMTWITRHRRNYIKNRYPILSVTCSLISLRRLRLVYQSALQAQGRSRREYLSFMKISSGVRNHLNLLTVRETVIISMPWVTVTFIRQKFSNGISHGTDVAKLLIIRGEDCNGKPRVIWQSTLRRKSWTTISNSGNGSRKEPNYGMTFATLSEDDQDFLTKIALTNTKKRE